jgi:hypothetical protein
VEDAVTKALLLLVLLTLPGIMWAKEAPGSASNLEATCKVWTTWDAAGRPKTQATPALVVQTGNMGTCLGYMGGWFNATDGAISSDDKGILGIATFSEGVNREQIAKVFVLYMAAHPAEENKLAHVALSDAMSDAGLLTWTVYKPGQ